MELNSVPLSKVHEEGLHKEAYSNAAHWMISNLISDVSSMVHFIGYSTYDSAGLFQPQ
jgi:hypothetical protein